MEVFRSCAVCKHGSVTFGTSDYSEVTPGEPPGFSCEKYHTYELDEAEENLLVALRVLGSKCPDFELMDDSKGR